MVEDRPHAGGRPRSAGGSAPPTEPPADAKEAGKLAEKFATRPLPKAAAAGGGG
jgi:hypothetical protein